MHHRCRMESEAGVLPCEVHNNAVCTSKKAFYRGKMVLFIDPGFFRVREKFRSAPSVAGSKVKPVFLPLEMHTMLPLHVKERFLQRTTVLLSKIFNVGSLPTPLAFSSEQIHLNQPNL